MAQGSGKAAQQALRFAALCFARAPHHVQHPRGQRIGSACSAACKREGAQTSMAGGSSIMLRCFTRRRRGSHQRIKPLVGD
jgi:hypothetical protein